MSTIRRYLSRTVVWWQGLSLWPRVGVIALVFAIVIGGIYFLKSRAGAAPAEAAHLRTVSVASVIDLENNTTPLPLIGQVKSVNEADIRTESGGAITHLYHKLGDYVAAGSIIAEIDNSSEQAALLQAQGVLEAAQASVQKSGTLFTESKQSAIDAIRTAYSSNDDIVTSKLDVMFSNPNGSQPQFVLSVSNQTLLNKAQTERLQLAQILGREANRATSLSDATDLQAELAQATDDTRVLQSYVTDVAALLNISLPSSAYSQSTINGFIATASLARAAVSGSLASLSATSQGLITANTNPVSSSQVSSSDATLKQAQGAYAAAQANLEKTIIRAPISGTINSLSLNLGDYVSAFQDVAVVSNNGALEIIANITPEDRAAIAVGAHVKIENQYDGVIISIAPAVDPTTKKIEVKIAFSGTAHNLTSGESVHLDIMRAAQKSAQTAQLTLPISTIKINPDGTVVFTVNETHHLVAHTVTTGTIVGDKIQILSGVTTDMQLVTDARGLKDGELIDLQ